MTKQPLLLLLLLLQLLLLPSQRCLGLTGGQQNLPRCFGAFWDDLGRDVAERCGASARQGGRGNHWGAGWCRTIPLPLHPSGGARGQQRTTGGLH